MGTCNAKNGCNATKNNNTVIKTRVASTPAPHKTGTARTPVTCSRSVVIKAGLFRLSTNAQEAKSNSCCFRLEEQAEWRKIGMENLPSMPSLYRGTFDINSNPKDTFLHMKDWTKGIVFINGHNLGRYWKIGPQLTMYLPSPWLRKGTNEVSF